MSDKNKLQINVLGDLEVIRGSARVRLPPSKKTRALLGYLVLTGRPHRRERLCSLLWDVTDDPRGALRWSLSKLRPLVDQPGAARVATDRENVWFEARGAKVDAVELRRVLRDGTTGLDLDTLCATADAFRGTLLEGLELTDFHEFHAWCVGQREEARALHARTLRALLDRLREQPLRALPYARTLTQLDPLDEAARVTLIRLLVELGRRNEAQQQVESAERQMRELGVEPSGQLGKAWRELRTGGPLVPAVSSPSTPTVTESGPEPVFDDETPLVGRTEELTRLKTMLAGAIEARCAHAILVTGEPGVGKTRLMTAFLALARARRGIVLQGRAFEAESGRPYGPWIDAFRSTTALSVDDALASPLARLLPELSASPADESRTELFGAVVKLMASNARSAPVMVVALDDVQWLDAASAELLHYVVRTNRHDPVVVVMASRGGEVADNASMQRVLRGLRRDRLLDEVELGPLTRDETTALVTTVAPGCQDARVYEQSAGNPLFALELARADCPDGDRLPPTLASLVRDRVDRLSPACADLLRWCAVLGRSADVTQLSALSALSAEELITALEQLERRRLLQAESGTYTFGHDIVRDVMYAELSEPRRRLMHQRIAQWLAASPAAGDAVAADIAHHAALGGDAAMAVQACISAGRRCLWLFASTEASTLAKRGMRYAAQLPEPSRTTTILDLWDIQLAAVFPTEVETVAAELERLAERALDHGCAEHARLGFHLLSFLRWEGGAQSDAARHMLHAEQVTRGTDGKDRVIALAEAARCLVLLDRDHGDAEALVLEARALSARTGIETPAIADAIGLLRAHQGELDEAARRFREAQDQARHFRNRLAEFYALEHLAMLELERGDLAAAAAVSADLSQLGAKLREGSEGPCARALAATLAYAASERAAHEVEASLQELRNADATQRLTFVLIMLATIDLDRGHCERALARARDALGFAERLHRPSDVAWARVLVARAAAALEQETEVDRQLAELGRCDRNRLAARVRRLVEPLLEMSQGES